MTFFDTCIWIELLAANAPETEKDRRQATYASDLLNQTLENKEIVVTCAEQILEIFSAVQKYKMKEYNRTCKATQAHGVGNLKEFRQTQMFGDVQKVCRQVYEDINRLSQYKKVDLCEIEKIIENIHLVDINDYLYYEFCNSNEIDFYTFDKDFTNLPLNPKIHIMSD